MTKKRGDLEEGPIALLEEYEGYLIHDHFKAYQRLDKCHHAECNAHIERYMKAGIDIDKSEECQEMLDLLQEMLSKKYQRIEDGYDFMKPEQIESYEKRYLEIAQRGKCENRN